MTRKGLRPWAPTTLSLVYSPLFARVPVSIVDSVQEGHTSQFSRIKQRPPATDLSGPKASADSLTPRRSNLAAEDAVDFRRSNLFSSAVLGSLSLGRDTSWT